MTLLIIIILSRNYKYQHSFSQYIYWFRNVMQNIFIFIFKYDIMSSNWFLVWFTETTMKSAGKI